MTADASRAGTFPPGFLWGAATASHQVEGDNRRNDWWAWEQVPGHIRDGSVSGRASDWWRRAEADLTLAAELGHNSHRLSIEWSRLQPGPDVWDPAPLARYRRILTHMRAVGLEPMVTLHHFTLPLWLAQRGGWGARRHRAAVRPVCGARGRGTRRSLRSLVHDQRADGAARLWASLSRLATGTRRSVVPGPRASAHGPGPCRELCAHPRPPAWGAGRFRQACAPVRCRRSSASGGPNGGPISWTRCSTVGRCGPWHVGAFADRSAVSPFEQGRSIGSGSTITRAAWCAPACATAIPGCCSDSSTPTPPLAWRVGVRSIPTDSIARCGGWARWVCRCM